MSEVEHSPTTSGVHNLTVDEDSAGQRLDNYLVRELKGVPKTRLYRALRKGEIRVNKGRVKADTAPVPRYWAQQIGLRLVYEDENLLVINKPSGLAVHGGSGLSFGLIESLRQLRPADRFLELVHRLDRDTSGLIMVARRPAMLRELHRQLREDKVDKRYLALVAGNWPKSLRVVEAPLEKNVLQSGERMVRVAREGKRSVTEFTVVERFDGATLVEAKPVTGRTHQIRVHARHAGFPLLGDDKYCDERSAALTRTLGLQRLFLHARSLRISLPESGPLTLEVGLDPELESILVKLRN